MTLQERIEQTEKWFTELGAIEAEMNRLKEWRDAARDMGDFTEYYNVVTKLLDLEKKSIFMRCCLAHYWFSKEDEQRCKEIQTELLFRK